MLKNMKLGPKLIIVFLLVGIVPFAAIGVVSLVESSRALSNQAFGQLSGVREIKKAQVENYFARKQHDMNVLLETVETNYQSAFSKLASVQELKKSQIEDFFKKVRADVVTLSKSSDILQMYSKLSRYHDEMRVGPTDSYDVTTGEYIRLYDENSGYLNGYVEEYGYYDMFLICKPHGHVMYTAVREDDLGTNLGYGPYKNEGLARLWRKVIETESVVFEDFSSYSPSKGEQAAFVGAPVFGEDGRFLGLVALQIPTDPMNRIVQKREGMGQTGETYLVGKVDGKTVFRSDLITMGDGKYKIGYEAHTSYVEKALSGESNKELYTDSKGNLVMVAYDPLDIPWLNWASVSTINLEEAISPENELNGEEFYARYIKEYGYYDLFLIHPEGKVFYSVTREADYNTNMVSGKYSGSGLGKLVRKVLGTNNFGVADFEPYAPSNNEPAAFIAQPLIHDNRVELVVALQLSLDEINSIMQQREGMGETGETYLVGPDRLMRSDSFLDKVHRTVKASFADPERGSVETVATEEALRGVTDIKIITDYNNNKVLSAYGSLKVGDITWAIIAEIDEREAFASVSAIKWFTAVIAVVGIVIITLIALVISRSITKPIVKAVDFAESMSRGDFSGVIEIDQRDEIGALASALNNMTLSLKGMITEVVNGVDVLSNSSAELSGISTHMSSNAEQTTEKSNTVAGAAEEMSSSIISVAAAMEQSATNVGHVAAATEEMTATINEIAKNSENARTISEKAVIRARSASGKMEELGLAAMEISNVTEAIAEISEQTNLLALNATIEAARAGEAGKGFAVVASEIKDLARKTAEATREIKMSIGGVQETTSGTVEEIGQVGTIINDIDEIIATIASSIEEQSIATKEIAENIGQASQGIMEVNENVSTNSIAVGEVVREITEVNHAAGEMSESSVRVNTSSQELAGLSDQLKELVSQFKI